MLQPIVAFVGAALQSPCHGRRPSGCRDVAPDSALFNRLKRQAKSPIHAFAGLLAMIVAGALTGCGTTSAKLATEQLLQSDAVDTAVADIDFTALAGQRCYLDTQYVADFDGVGFVNSNYIISAIRQEMTAEGLLLQDSADTAEVIVEPRVGTLGSDDHDILYGIPASNFLSTAASALPNSPALPAIPEVAFMKRADLMAAAKLSVFAYHRDTRMPVWQSGTSVARSNSRDTWVLGAGPFTRGTIYNGWRFAGTRVDLPLDTGGRPQDRPEIATFHSPHLLNPELLEPKPEQVEGETQVVDDSAGESEVGKDEVVPASAEVPAE